MIFNSFYWLDFLTGAEDRFRALPFILDGVAEIVVSENKFLVLSDDWSFSSNVFEALLLVSVLVGSGFVGGGLDVGHGFLVVGLFYGLH